MVIFSSVINFTNSIENASVRFGFGHPTENYHYNSGLFTESEAATKNQFVAFFGKEQRRNAIEKKM